MRIGIDASGTYGWRGPSRNISNIIKTLVEIDQVNQYYLFSIKEPEIVLPPKGNYHWMKIPKRRFVPWLNVSLPLAALRNRIDVFLFPQANFWLWKPIKTVVLTRAATIEPWRDNIYDRISTNIRKARFSKIPDRIGCVSHYNATLIHYVFNVPLEKMEVINNGVDPAFLDHDVKPFDGYGEYILYTGGTEPRKNVKRLVAAYAMACKNDVSASLVMVGGRFTQNEPDMRALLDTKEAKHVKNRIILHGIEKDSKKLASLYRGARLVVYPSIQEDFGMVSVEAMASCVPLVASNASSIPEIAGDAALYFDPYDPEDMSRKIIAGLSDEKLRSMLVARGRERVKKYSWEDAAKLIIEMIYRTATKRGKTTEHPAIP